MKSGALSAVSYTQACLDRIAETEAAIGAWVHLDRDLALSQASAADERRRQGRALGMLHGVPVGLKDIIDTTMYPTERGSSIFLGRQPGSNAALVERLLEAGALILGKTVTTELAWMHPSKTRNAVNPEFSPGGSSSGSAAAVAAAQVPLTLGTQTGGSVIRPASFNGVFGYKPSRGLMSRRGILQTSPSLDQPGVFGNDLGDICLFSDALKGYDSQDSVSYLAPRPELLAGYHAAVPVEPAFAWIDMPYANRYADSLKAGIQEFCEVIRTGTRATLETIQAPRSFAALPGCHQIIYDVEILSSLQDLWTLHRDQLSETAVAGLTRAESRTQDEYAEALGIQAAAQDWFDTFFHDYDGILTPSATGIAPPLGQGTGDPICCVIWTLCGLPCLSMPLLTGEHDMPMGIQLVGAHDRDDRLMRTAHWLLDALTDSAN
ncbi:MAG: amidase [Granulosicoccus sp.]|nr:amidase [Granulosicoccus sp.]